MQSRASLFAAVLTGLAVLGLSTWSQAVQAETRQPVVVELYTSQGCSSCPPADAFLGELARQDDVIALSLHVDYWDDMGWKDTFASPNTTARQRAYKQVLNSRYVYTPQIVVDGRGHAVGSRRAEVRALIAEARARAKPRTGARPCATATSCASWSSSAPGPARSWCCRSTWRPRRPPAAPAAR